MLTPIMSAVHASTIRALARTPPLMPRRPGTSSQSAITVSRGSLAPGDDHVALDLVLQVLQPVGRDVLEGGHGMDALRHQRRHQLGAGALPDADQLRGAVADGGRQRHAHRDHDLTGLEVLLQALHRGRGVLEGHGEDHDSGLPAVASSLPLPSTLASGTCCLTLFRRLDGALGLARADHHVSPCLGKAQSQAEALVSGSSENRDPVVCAHGGRVYPEPGRFAAPTQATPRAQRFRPRGARVDSP